MSPPGSHVGCGNSLRRCDEHLLVILVEDPLVIQEREN
jgi:hypothetical protein